MKSDQVRCSTNPEHLPGSSYQSYLLRLWQVGSAEDSLWRAFLENITSGETIGFESLPDLCAYLAAETSQTDAPTQEGDQLKI